MTGGRRRRGIQVLVVVFLVALLAVIGLAVYEMAVQSGRSSHWFYLGQMAHNGADAGLKAALAMLEAEAARPAGILSQLHEDLAAGNPPGPGTEIFSTRSNLPQELRFLTARALERGYALELTAAVEAADLGPLEAQPSGDIPVDPRERKGRIWVTATATVTARGGRAVTRTARAERGYSVVSILPPLLGRFGLYVGDLGDQDPNPVRTRFGAIGGDLAPGDGARVSGPAPLVYRAGAAGSVVGAGARDLDRSQLVGALAGDPTFLDKQGWVFLGSRSETPWTLKLAHGYGAEGGGESFLLPQTELRVKYGGTVETDEDWRQRVEEEFTRRIADCTTVLNPGDTPGLPPGVADGGLGLSLLVHGFAENAELIGTARPRQVQTRDGTRRRYEFPDENYQTSYLRLFGTPDRVSPTLVYGPVLQAFIQKAKITALFMNCPFRGVQEIPIYLPAENPPVARSIVEEVFEDQFDTYGTVRRGAPYLATLRVVLGNFPSGRYGPRGTVIVPEGQAAPPPGPTFSSALAPELGELPREIPRETFERFGRGEVAIEGLYDGNLHNGLGDFLEAMSQKHVYNVAPEATGRVLAERVFSGGVASVPGILYLESRAEQTVPPIDLVQEGGILVFGGDVVIGGDIMAGDDPLTIVALGERGIRIAEGVGQVAAYLVAPNGRVDFPSSGVVVQGGVAMATLDLEGNQLTGSEVVYDPRFDPLAADQPSPYRVYFGNETGTPRLMYGGR